MNAFSPICSIPGPSPVEVQDTGREKDLGDCGDAGGTLEEMGKISRREGYETHQLHLYVRAVFGVSVSQYAVVRVG
jgi:hypothetical protein